MSNETSAPRTVKFENDENFPFIELAAMARDQFLVFLKMSGFDSTRQSCVFGSHYLYMILKRFAPSGARVSITSGGMAPGTGFKAADGSLQKHMWVECASEQSLWIVDITADQFGFAPVCYALRDRAQDTFIPDIEAVNQQLLENMHRDDEVLRKMFEVNALDSSAD